MKLSPLFGQGMVLQRRQENLFWGYDKPNNDVHISFLGQRFCAKVDDNGYFQIWLPWAEAGGPYTLEAEGEECVVIGDIFMGDVFLLGGQSNMELPVSRTLDLYREEMKKAEEPMIRLFEVPKDYLFGAKREELNGGKWIKGTGEELLGFSAVGFFMAKDLRNTHSVPIGLIQTAVGGTPIKAWCSEESLEKAGLYQEELNRCKEGAYVEEIKTQEAARERQWMLEAKEGFVKPECSENTMVVPGLWEGTELEDFQGSMRIERVMFLTKEQSEKRAVLVFGAIVDADCIRINGTTVGETGYRYPPRRYVIPDGILREGANTIRIELLVFRGKGGFIPGKRYVLEWEEDANNTVSLEGEWHYWIGRSMRKLPETTFFQYMASGLYQGMMVPLRRYGIKAFVYYQGESNTDAPHGYCEQMQCVIRDWRALWENEKLPFLYVQLPGFADSKQLCEGVNWALLREEQRNLLEVSENTAMVVIHDVGEYNDLHPQNKKTVGIRLSLAIRGMVYGDDVVYRGPLCERMEAKKGGVYLYFTQIGSGLRASNNTGFEIVGEDGIWATACAKVHKDSVFVWAENVPKPKEVRYGWNDNPKDACLCNQEGLLASPFWKKSL